jgi:hypothetical protein
MHWTEAEYRDYKARVQLPLGRRVQGLERPKRVNTSALEWQEAERLTKWRDEEGIKIILRSILAQSAFVNQSRADRMLGGVEAGG